MSSVALDEQFFAKIAGWDVLKQARGVLAGERVLSSAWNPPVLKGVVQESSTSYRAGLVIKDAIDIENLCTCRASRDWGTICVHSVAVGLHHLRAKSQPPNEAAVQGITDKRSGAPTPSPAPRNFKRLKRADSENAEPLEIHVILPPNFVQALNRPKVMLCLEGKWAKGRSPLNGLPFSETYLLDHRDSKLLDLLEEIAGDTPGMLMIGGADLGRVLEALKGHPRVTLGKSTPFEISTEPVRLKIRAALEKSGEISLSLLEKIAETAMITTGNSTWTLYGNSIRPIFLPQNAAALLQATVRIPRSQIPVFLSQDWPLLSEKWDVDSNFNLEDFTLATA
jgi:hypothetical protein